MFGQRTPDLTDEDEDDVMMGGEWWRLRWSGFCVLGVAGFAFFRYG